MKKLNFSYCVPIKSSQVNKDFVIQGTALNATITSNNHKFIPKELQASARTIIGVPLLVDHRNEVGAVKGRVFSGRFNEDTNQVKFKAYVIDKATQDMIKDGRIDSVSVGADVSELEETNDGYFIPHGIVFKELSLVAVPADEGATFSIAMKESYELNKKEANKMRYNWKGIMINSRQGAEPKVKASNKVIKPNATEKKLQGMLNKASLKAARTELARLKTEVAIENKSEREAVKKELFQAKQKLTQLTEDVGLLGRITIPDKKDIAALNSKSKELKDLKEMVFIAGLKLRAEEGYLKSQQETQINSLKRISAIIGKGEVTVNRSQKKKLPILNQGGFQVW